VLLEAVLLLLAYVLVTGGAALLWSDRMDRVGGYIWGPPIPGATSGYAVTSDDIHLNPSGVQRLVDRVVDSVRLEVTPADPTDVVFVGVARSADVAAYLHGVAHRQVGDLGQGGATWGWLGPGTTMNRTGGPPAVGPDTVDIWLDRSIGTGTRTLTWPLVDGDWVIVVMRADGSAGVSVSVRTGASAPALGWICGGMILAGVGLAIGASLLTRRTKAAVHGRPTGGGPAPGGSTSVADADREERDFSVPTQV
jgi:hypothetical protein